MKSYTRLGSYVKPYISRFALAIACMGAISVLNGAIRLLVKPMIDRVFVAKEVNILYMIVVALPAMYLLLGLFNYAKTYLMSYIAHRITLNLRNDVYAKLQYLPLKFYTENTTGKIMSRLTNDIMAIQIALSRVPATIVSDGLTAIVLVGIIFYLHWRFALVSLIAFPFVSLAIMRLGARMRRFSHQSQKQMSEVYSNIQESLNALAIIKVFNRENSEIGRFQGINYKFYEFMMRLTKAEAVSSPLMEFLGALALGLVLFFAGKDVIAGVWTPGSFFAFFAAAFSVYQPLRNFANLNPLIQQAVSATDRVFELIDEPPETADKNDAFVLKDFQSEITFENISFSYSDRNNVLDNITFSIKKGESVAIVGPSGSGKTTIINLILRFYDPDQGRICIDGRDIREISRKSLRDQMSIVTQDTILFNETVSYNIKYGKENATDEEIIEAAVAAQVHPFVEKMPQGYNTIVGERGVLLSGGEKQRIAIARAIIRNPKILLLDEATSALDAESEELVQKALQKLMEGRTIILIAHKLSTVKSADKIVVIEGGRIVDMGSHNELFNKEGLYKKLHQLQLI